MKKTTCLLLCMLSAGCVTTPATLGALPKERATECVQHCASLDMKLAAVVIIRSSAGCVCTPKEEPAPSAAGAAAAAGALLAEEDETKQRAANASGR